MTKFKNNIKKKVQRLLLRKGYLLSNSDRFSLFGLILNAYIRRNNDFFFIEIGANDGKSFDPIYEFVTVNHTKVRGIVIEPLKDYFEELKNNYRKYPNIITANFAIHNSKKSMTLYRVDPKRMNNLPMWAKGIASFNENHHQLSEIPKNTIIQEEVKCFSLNEVIETFQVAKVDLLQIDTEGYDSEIILNIDFKTMKPKIIHFEHGVTAGVMKKGKFSEIIDLLHNNGYEIWMDSNDATAYQRNIITVL